MGTELGRHVGQELERQIREYKPDAVIIEHLITSRFLPYVRRATDAPIIFCEHNAEYLYETQIARQAGLSFNGIMRRTQVSKVRRLEKSMLEMAMITSAISDHDREMLQRLAPSARLYTLPPGVDMDYFTPNPAVAEEERIVFAGVLFTVTNTDGAECLARRILPIVRASD